MGAGRNPLVRLPRELDVEVVDGEIVPRESLVPDDDGDVIDE